MEVFFFLDLYPPRTYTYLGINTRHNAHRAYGIVRAYWYFTFYVKY
jgi:hypothetical protein